MSEGASATLIATSQSTNVDANETIAYEYLTYFRDKRNSRDISKKDKLILVLLIFVFIANFGFTVAVFINLEDQEWRNILILADIIRIILIGMYSAYRRNIIRTNPSQVRLFHFIWIVLYGAPCIVASTNYWFGDERPDNKVILADIIIASGAAIILCASLLISILYTVYKCIAGYFEAT